MHFVLVALLGACNAEDEGPVSRAANTDRGDADVGEDAETDAATEVDAGNEVAPEELIGSRLADALASDEFRDATCRLAGVAAEAGGSGVSCEDVVSTCLDTFGSLDASVPLGPALPDTALELQDCEVPLPQLDACLAELVGVVVELSMEVECGADAGVFASSVGPETLLQAPSCLVVVTTCPALLDLFLASMPL